MCVLLTGTQWGLVALAGLAVVAIANALRARRTGRAGCLGQVFVAAHQLTRPELVLNRTGLVAFVAGVVLALVA